MDRRPNVFLAVCFSYAIFFALLADALWLYSFPLFPSHLQVQASSFGSAPNPQPAQAPSHESAAPTPQPFSTSTSSSPASAPQTSSSPSASPTSQPFSTSSSSPAPAPAPQTSSSPSPSPSPSPSVSDASSSQTRKGAISQDDPALGDICDKTDYPDLCRSSVVVPFLHNKIDHFAVIKLSIDACINHTQAAIHKASELAASNPDATEIVQVCQECYATAVDELKQSAIALAARDLGTFRSKMSSVITNIGTCDETFGEDPEMDSSSPLTAIDQTITRLASNILAIGERI